MRLSTAFLEISVQFPLGGKMDNFCIMCDSLVIEIENPISVTLFIPATENG